MIQDVKTRWNSTYYMVQRFIEQKKCISLYSAENNITNISANEWNILEAYLQLLEPFEQITMSMSRNESIISECIPSITALENYLNSFTPSLEIIGVLKEILIQKLQLRLDSLDLENELNYSIATFVDPRFKTKVFKSKDSADNTKQIICEKIIEEIEKKKTEMITSEDERTNTDTENSPEDPNLNTENNEVNLPTKKRSIWDCLDAITQIPQTEENGQSDGVRNEVKTMVNNEVTNYLNSGCIKRTDDPLKWWEKNARDYPNLAEMVMKYLSAPATSVYSERLFSEAGTIYEDKRNRLLPRNAEKLLFLHNNLLKTNVQFKF